MIFALFSGNYVLNYLYNQPKLAQFVIQGLVTLFARITNLGWFDSKDDDFVFRNVIGKWFDEFLAIFGNFTKFFCQIFLGDVTKFLQGHHADHCMIGVQLLSQLTCEMNQVRFSRVISRNFTWFHEIFHEISFFFTDFRSRRQS